MEKILTLLILLFQVVKAILDLPEPVRIGPGGRGSYAPASQA